MHLVKLIICVTNTATKLLKGFKGKLASVGDLTYDKTNYLAVHVAM